MSTKDLWEKAEEIVRQRIADGRPCENTAHFDRMVEEKRQELLEDAIDRAKDRAHGMD